MNPQLPPPPELVDFAILGYIAFFGFLSAVLIVREGRLGWALFCKNAAYSLAFGYTALGVVLPIINDYEYLRDGLRILIVLTLTWAMFELLYARYLLWKQNGRDPRLIIGRRERVVGKREVVATKREDVVTQRENCLDGRDEPCE